jgi:hypothetical protein
MIPHKTAEGKVAYLKCHIIVIVLAVKRVVAFEWKLVQGTQG